MSTTFLERLPSELRIRYERLGDILHGMERVVVAFSGGVDSTFLLAAAVERLGGNAVAVTAESPSLPQAEREEVVALVARLGARHRWIQTDEMARPGYVANEADRCFHCKAELFERLRALAQAEGCRWILDGANTDDLGDFRPGRDAARQHGVRSPLVEAGLNKDSIRALSRAMGLPTADKPAMACLASRIPTGTPVTIERLGQVERAEAALGRLGFRHVRVRHHEAIARIELDPDQRARMLDPDLCVQVVVAVKAAGYKFVTLDLEGYKPGGRPNA